jgi:CBS domain-containing protein
MGSGRNAGRPARGTAEIRQVDAEPKESRMRARDVMTAGMVTVRSNMPAPDAMLLMRQKGIHHLLVQDGSARVGIVSERDLGGRRAPAVARDKTVADLMTAHVITVDGNATPRQVANVMRGRSIGSVVVMERGRAAGLITISDLLELIGRGSARPVTEARRRDLHHRTPHRRSSGARGLW